MKKWIERVFAKIFARFYEKKIILGTSDAWSTSRLSHWPSKPAYYIVDWRIFESLKGSYGKMITFCLIFGVLPLLQFLEHVRLDTGHFFNTSLIQGLVFKGIVKGQESKVWAFFKGLRSFRGPQKQNWKNDQNSIIFGAKIKVRINFIWEKLMEFLLLNEVLKNWIFFQLPIQKSDFITLILSKFSILNANLWSIYSKRFEFMVYTCFCAF